MHYTRWRKHGGTEVVLPNPRLRPPGCSVADCPNRHKGLGYCKKHYKRFKAHGDPTLLAPYARGPREVHSYKTAHERLRYWRGAAKTHACACGDPAAQWSYDHNDPNELWDTVPDQRGHLRPVPWSRDMDHYQALCTGCHLRRDRNWKSKSTH
jgi:hypothetical protein